jgi:hypothetical protein
MSNRARLAIARLGLATLGQTHYEPMAEATNTPKMSREPLLRVLNAGFDNIALNSVLLEPIYGTLDKYNQRGVISYNEHLVKVIKTKFSAFLYSQGIPDDKIRFIVFLNEGQKDLEITTKWVVYHKKEYFHIDRTDPDPIKLIYELEARPLRGNPFE